jgi:hypothetical protein
LAASNFKSLGLISFILRIASEIAKDNAAKAKKVAAKRTREAKAKVVRSGAAMRKTVGTATKKATPKIIKQHVGRKRI